MKFPWQKVFWGAAKEGLKSFAWSLFKKLFGSTAEEKPEEVKKRKAVPK